MAVKTLITREFKPDRTDQGYEILTKLRSRASVQEGYISGETLVSAENPCKVVVVSQWISKKRWEEWNRSQARREISDTLAPLLAGPETAEVFWVGIRSPEWVDMA